jgi:hypothetical protein
MANFIKFQSHVETSIELLRGQDYLFKKYYEMVGLKRGKTNLEFCPILQYGKFMLVVQTSLKSNKFHKVWRKLEDYC